MTPRLPSKPKSPERLAAEAFGRRGETLAVWLLRAKLYRIRNVRYKTPVGEIDIVAERFGTLVFVEVKARRSFEAEEDAIIKVNRRRIIRAAEHYLGRYPAVSDMPMRFDMIFLAPRQWPRHVIGAFDAS
jgi:putative endonuclease